MSYNMLHMKGLYETFFSTLSADSTLQGLLSGTAVDKKVYPIHHAGASNPPAVRIAVHSGSSEVGRLVERVVVDVLIASASGTTQLNSISRRIDELVNRQRLPGPNGLVVHLCVKMLERDAYDAKSLEYRRIIRYGVIMK